MESIWFLEVLRVDRAIAEREKYRQHRIYDVRHHKIWQRKLAERCSPNRPRSNQGPPEKDRCP